jgi:hypothetical protein
VSDPLAVLQRIRQARPEEVDVLERCDLCSEPIPSEHGHLVDVEGRGLRCACRGCYLLFTSEGAGGRRFRAVPERFIEFVDFGLSPAQWESLQIPVGLAFFFHNSALGRIVAFYPGPAGATESELSLDAWQAVLDANSGLVPPEPDVEALLVRMEPQSTRAECFLVPIDACYELVGRLRRSWRGFDGGSEARSELDSFFGALHERCTSKGAAR